MEISFPIDDATATYSRNWFSGRAAVFIDGQTVGIQSPWNPATHFSLRLTRVRAVEVRNHKVSVEHTRPLFFAGFREQTFRVFVDDNLVAEATGH